MSDYEVNTGSASALLRLSVSSVRDIPNNRSTVNWYLAFYKGSANSNAASVRWDVNIGGAPAGGFFSFNFASNPGIVIASGSVVIDHDPDGTKAIAVAATIGATGTSSGGPASVGGTETLTRIPRGGRVRVGGAWKPSRWRIRVGGAWKDARVRIRVGGAWKDAI